MPVIRLLLLALIAGTFLHDAIAAASIDADARRGSQLFAQQMCTKCHGQEGKPGAVAPDLGKRLDREYTPAGIAARMWNHAPVMWAAMKDQSVTLPRLEEAQVDDLFAYFYSAR